MRNVIIFGVGQIAEAVFDLINQIPDINVLSFTADEEYINKDNILDKKIVPLKNLDEQFDMKNTYLITAVGYKKLNSMREKIYQRLKKKNYKFTNIIHPNSLCRFKNIGENNIIFEFNNIQSGVQIGNNTIIWSSNHIGHHSEIGDNCFISSHVVISGSVKVSNNNFLGVNSTIRDNISIGANCIIGAGSLVQKSLPENSILRNKSTDISKIKSDKIK